MNVPGSASLTRFAAVMGLDWSDGKHDICLQITASGQRETLILEHRPEAIDEWARALRHRFGGQPVAIALELAKGPIVHALRKYEFIVLFPINPATLAKYREVFTHSGAACARTACRDAPTPGR